MREYLAQLIAESGTLTATVIAMPGKILWHSPADTVIPPDAVCRTVSKTSQFDFCWTRTAKTGNPVGQRPGGRPTR